MSKICPECSTANEDEYTFCKNCGARLTAGANENNYSAEYNQSGTNYGENMDFTGVSAEEMSLFLGKKAPLYLNKFRLMEITGKKSSWNWSVAVLSIFFGPFGAAIWFFYRKMYKPAGILSVIGAVLQIITAIFQNSFNIAPFINAFEENFNSLYNLVGTYDFKEILPLFIYTLLSDGIGIATMVLTGIFANYLYKNHCITKITAYKRANANSNFYRLGLASIGGTSGGMAFLGVIIMIASTKIVNDAVAIISNIGGKML